MFYYLAKPLLIYNVILIAAAVIPAGFLLLKVYRADRVEKEGGRLLGKVFIAGVLASLLALVEERIGMLVLSWLVPEGSVLYNILLYFVLVAFAEESSKYILLRRRTWADPEFNCQFDGVVYAVFVSLGFAAWENISYVLSYGLGTALVRAVTAIPGHACFGVFMGVFYGFARRSAVRGDGGEKKWSAAALALPALLHGAYDYIASLNRTGAGWLFLLFVLALFLVSFRLVSRSASDDRYFR